MSNRRLNILFLLSLSLAGCATTYADPSMRGALFDTDVLRIPAAYHGLWARPLDACGVTRDYGMQVQIGETSVETMQLRRVMNYSDDAAIMIDLVSDESDVDPTETIFLELSNDGKYLRMDRGGSTAPIVFQRCLQSK